MNARFRFTVFTPTYNRANLLPRLYASLLAQSFRDFEWLIVDDGSTGATRELVERWQEDSPFPVRYLWQANAGKHVAFNRAAQEAAGELLLEIDSDDEMLPHALARFAEHWAAVQALPPDEAATFSGVTALCQDQHGRLIGKRFPKDVIDSNPNVMRYRYRATGEKWGFHRTELLREFPFPALAGGSFVPESLVWNAMGRRYKTRYVNDVLRVYWQHDAERLTTAGKVAVNAPGHALWHRDVLNTNLRYFRHSPAEFARSAVHFARCSFHAGDGPRTQWQVLTAPARVLWVAALPLGWLVYRKDRHGAISPPARVQPASAQR